MIAAAVVGVIALVGGLAFGFLKGGTSSPATAATPAPAATAAPEVVEDHHLAGVDRVNCESNPYPMAPARTRRSRGRVYAADRQEPRGRPPRAHPRRRVGNPSPDRARAGGRAHGCALRNHRRTCRSRRASRSRSLTATARSARATKATPARARAIQGEARQHALRLPRRCGIRHQAWGDHHARGQAPPQGSLRITTEAGAEVFVEGEAVGTAPVAAIHGRLARDGSTRPSPAVRRASSVGRHRPWPACGLERDPQRGQRATHTAATGAAQHAAGSATARLAAVGGCGVHRTVVWVRPYTA